MNDISAKIDRAEIIREFIPLDAERIHGLTFDGKLVWFARESELVAFDPERETVVRRFEVPKANAGTAYDGKHLYQLAGGEILVIEPDSGTVVRRMDAPGKGEDSGMAWADGYLWIGQYYKSQIHKVSAETGEVVKTLNSDRFVTGVSCIGGELWHGATAEGKPWELRRLAPDGNPEERLEVPVGRIAGMERTEGGDFWCAGEEGKIRLVRKKRASA